MGPKQQGCEARQAGEQPEPVCSAQRGFQTKGAALAKSETCVLRMEARSRPLQEGQGQELALRGLAVLSGQGRKCARTGQSRDGPGGAWRAPP